MVDNQTPTSEARRSLPEIVEEAGVKLQDQFDSDSQLLEREKIRVQVDQLAYILTELAKFGRYLKNWFAALQKRPN